VTDGPTRGLATLLSGLLGARARSIDSREALALTLVNLPSFFAVGVVCLDDVALSRVVAQPIEANDQKFGCLAPVNSVRSFWAIETAPCIPD
jgi:hypothetical protein